MDMCIAHTVAYLLRCHGRTGDGVDDDDDDDNGNGARGDKVDNDCDARRTTTSATMMKARWVTTMTTMGTAQWATTTIAMAQQVTKSTIR
jgi:hypothetical protein